MADELIDTLIIDVELNSSNAEQGIEKLTKNLGKLQSFLDKFDTSSLEKVAKSLNNLGKTDLSNLTTALKDLRESLGALSKPLGKKATENLKNALDTYYKSNGQENIIGQISEYSEEFDEQFSDKHINVDIDYGDIDFEKLVEEYLKAFDKLTLAQDKINEDLDKYKLKAEDLANSLEENTSALGTEEYEHAEQSYEDVKSYVEYLENTKKDLDELVNNILNSDTVKISDIGVFNRITKQLDGLDKSVLKMDSMTKVSFDNLTKRAKKLANEFKVDEEEGNIFAEKYYSKPNETLVIPAEIELNDDAFKQEVVDENEEGQELVGNWIDTEKYEKLDRQIDTLKTKFNLLKLEMAELSQTNTDMLGGLEKSLKYADSKDIGRNTLQYASAMGMTQYIDKDIKMIEEAQQRIENQLFGTKESAGLFDMEVGNENTIKNIEKLINEYASLNSEVLNTNNTAKTLQTQLQTITKETTNMGYKVETFFKKLGKRFISVLSYRMIRKLIQQIVKMATEGLQNVAQVDDNINESMSNLLNSFNALKSSFGASIGYFAEMIEPILTPIIDLFTDIMNLVNQFLSALAGNTTYQKAIKTQEDYADALAKTKANATGIDELNTVSNETTPDEMYEETEIASGIASIGNSLNKVFKILGEILELLEPIFDIVDAIFDALDPVFELIGGILDLVMEVLDLVVGQITDSISTISNMITDFLGYFKDVCNLFTGFLKGVFTGDWTLAFDSLKQIVCDFANFFIHIWNHLVEFLENMINTVCGWINKIGSWFGADWNLGVDFSVVKGEDLTIDMFANGGFPAVGELFIANEVGAEMVGTIGGHTAVANNDQIVEGVSNGVYEGVLQALQDADTNSNSNINITVQIDGKDVASRIKLDQGGAVMYRSGV